ncbi:MAG: leucine-rich repeat protein [Clostridia bacterium]|nr:leucine-rich repeat protein [Clostridia bacterium]
MNEKQLFDKLNKEAKSHIPDVYDKVLLSAKAEGLLDVEEETSAVYSDGDTVVLGGVNKKGIAITTLASLTAVCLTIALPIALSNNQGGIPPLGGENPPMIENPTDDDKTLSLGDNYAIGAVSTAKLLCNFMEEVTPAPAVNAMALRSVSESEVAVIENYFDAFETFFGEIKAEPVKVPGAESKYANSVNISGVRANGDAINYYMYYTEAKVVEDTAVEGAPQKYYIEGVISVGYGEMLLLGERTLPKDGKAGNESSLSISAYPNENNKNTYVKMEVEYSVENNVSVKKYIYTVVVDGDTVGGAILYSPNQEESNSNVAFALDILGVGSAEDISYEVFRPEKQEKEFYVNYKARYDRGNFSVTLTDSGYEYDYVLSGLFVSKSNGDGTCEITSYNKNKTLPESLFIPSTHNGNTVVSIGVSAFAKNKKISHVYIPEGIVSIGNSAFSDTDVKEVELPDSLKTIGYSVFENCKNLNKINLPDGLESINVVAFSFCESLQSLHIPASVTKINGNIVKGCSALTSLTVDEANTVYTGKGNCIIQKSSKSVIAGCKTSVIPNDGSVEKIEQNAFDHCQFNSIIVPEGVTDIKTYAFNSCTEMVSIELPESLINIETGAFDSCTKLASLHIPSKVKNIKERAFYGCSAIESLTVDGNNTRYKGVQNCIVDYLHPTLGVVVLGCKNSVIPTDENVKTIGSFAFGGITTLTQIEIPANIRNLYSYAFSKSGLTSVTIPETVEQYSNDLFAGCINLTAVTLPQNLGGISDSMFSGCTALVNINIPEGVTYIARCAFENCSSLKSITLPNSLQSLRERAFYGTGLTELVIPASVTVIENNCFGDCTNLRKVTIPANVTKMSTQVFYGCIALKEIAFEGTLSQWNALEKGTGWYYAVRDCRVTCKDGQNVVIDWFDDLNA